MKRKTTAVFLFLTVAILTGCDDSSTGDARRWLDLEIEHPKLEPFPEWSDRGGTEVEDADENGMITRAYIVAPGFMTTIPGEPAGPEIPDEDPFTAEPQNVPPVPHPPQKVLEGYGVVFEPGSRVVYSRKKAVLTITQTPEQMDLVEAIVSSVIGSGPGDWSTITVRFEIYELPGGRALELERSAGEHYEHSPERNAVLELVRKGQAEIVTTANLLCRSGQRTFYRDGIEIPQPGSLEVAPPESRRRWETSKGPGDEEKPTVVRPGMRFAGTAIEVDPVMGPDWRTLDINYRIEHNPRPSLTRRMEAIETIHAGTVKLLGSWPAGEAPDEPARSQVVFMKATAVADMQARLRNL